ncbi:MAG: DUF3592 domain-containing protein [Ruminococcus sp.]|nr:DUF3592 domain-containing protein [Ruminococcus sp.]
MSKNENRNRLSVSPSALGLFVFVLSICISAVFIVRGYMPYREYLSISKTCTRSASAKVVGGEQIEEGIYYYGPKVEYYDNSLGSVIRADIVNTVKFKKKIKNDETVMVMYDPSDYSLVMIKDDNTASDRFRMMNITASAIFAVGMAFLIAAVLIQFLRTRPKKYDTAPDGSTFEEWQKKKQLEEIARDTAGDKEEEDGKDKK